MASVNMKDDKGSCVLLTEGTNDCHVIAALCNSHNIQEGRFGFYACGSDDKVLKKVNALLAAYSPKKAIGIVLDADVDLSGRWKSIQAKLSNYGYDFTDTPEHEGSILTSEDMPTLGIWIMPNNQDVGMLEDFCATLIDPEHLNIAQQAVENIKNMDVSSFKPVHRTKADIHTYLAWQDEPGKPIGQSITSKVLNAEAETATVFVAWLNKLFPAT